MWLAVEPGLVFADDGQFRYGEDRSPSTLHPAYGRTMVDTRLEELIFEGLFSYDRFLNPVPALAARAEFSEDRTKATVYLRQSFWHDGEPVTPADVVFTVQALQNPASKAAARPTVALIESVKITGPNELQFAFKRPLVMPEQALMFKVLPRHKMAGPPLRTKDRFRANPVGTGPFRFLKWSSTNLELTAHSGRTSGIRSILARFIPDKKVQLDFLQYDALDAVVRVLPRHRPVIEGMAGKIRLLPYESLSWWYLGVNHRRRALSSPDVRAALAFALDRDDLRRVHLGDGQTISGPFAPRSPFYNDDVAPRTFDKGEVSRRMKAAGYRKRRGFYTKRGSRLKLRLAVNKNWNAYKDVILDLQSRLRTAGFDIKLDWLEPAVWRQRVQKKKDFDLSIGAWSFDEASDVYDLFHSQGGLNYCSYASDRMDALLDQSRRTRDPELFREIQRRVHAHAHEDLPYIFLWGVVSEARIRKSHCIHWLPS
ncbi:MAG: ABC transporter substrate-binding protein, partial [Myxococcota bacterium]